MFWAAGALLVDNETLSLLPRTAGACSPLPCQPTEVSLVGCRLRLWCQCVSHQRHSGHRLSSGDRCPAHIVDIHRSSQGGPVHRWPGHPDRWGERPGCKHRGALQRRQHPDCVLRGAAAGLGSSCISDHPTGIWVQSQCNTGRAALSLCMLAWVPIGRSVGHLGWRSRCAHRSRGAFLLMSSGRCWT